VLFFYNFRQTFVPHVPPTLARELKVPVPKEIQQIVCTAEMLRPPADAESLVTAGGREVGDGRTQALTVAPRVTPAAHQQTPALSSHFALFRSEPHSNHKQ